jgi:hypothetical protein
VARTGRAGVARALGNRSREIWGWGVGQPRRHFSFPEAAAVAELLARSTRTLRSRFPPSPYHWSDLTAARPPSLVSGEAFARTKRPWAPPTDSTLVREHRTGAKTSRSGRSPRRPTARAKRGSAEGAVKPEARIGGRGQQQEMGPMTSRLPAFLLIPAARPPVTSVTRRSVVVMRRVRNEGPCELALARFATSSERLALPLPRSLRRLTPNLSLLTPSSRRPRPLDRQDAMKGQPSSYSLARRDRETRQKLLRFKLRLGSHLGRGVPSDVAVRYSSGGSAWTPSGPSGSGTTRVAVLVGRGAYR